MPYAIYCYKPFTREWLENDHRAPGELLRIWLWTWGGVSHILAPIFLVFFFIGDIHMPKYSMIMLGMFGVTLLFAAIFQVVIRRRDLRSVEELPSITV